MKTETFKFSRKATTALLLCTGLVASQPLSLWAENDSGAVQIVQQQKITVKGTVNDAMGPVIGASVVEKGNSSNGTITDMDGNFSLSVQPGTVLVVSYIGYKTQEVTATVGKAINVTLQEDNEMLDEVVVVGFGTQKKVKSDRLGGHCHSQRNRIPSGNISGSGLTRSSPRSENQYEHRRVG